MGLYGYLGNVVLSVSSPPLDIVLAIIHLWQMYMYVLVSFGMSGDLAMPVSPSTRSKLWVTQCVTEG